MNNLYDPKLGDLADDFMFPPYGIRAEFLTDAAVTGEHDILTGVVAQVITWTPDHQPQFNVNDVVFVDDDGDRRIYSSTEVASWRALPYDQCKNARQYTRQRVGQLIKFKDYEGNIVVGLVAHMSGWPADETLDAIVYLVGNRRKYKVYYADRVEVVDYALNTGGCNGSTEWR